MTQFIPEIRLMLHTSLQEAEHDWRQLNNATHGNPYQSFDWLNAWYETIGCKLDIEPLIAVARTDEKSVLVLPLAKQKNSGVTTLEFLGHQNGNQNTGIWDADYYETVAQNQITVLLEDIGRKARADLVLLQNVPETWHTRLHPLVLAGATPSPSPIFTRVLASDFDQLFRETHSKSSRKNLTRKQRHLQSADGYRVVQASSEEDLRKGFEAFLEQRSRRAVEAGIPNAFSEPAARDFLSRLLGLGAVGEDPEKRFIDLWYLEVAGAIRSTYLCVENADTIFAYSNSVAHDDMLPNSPGLVLIKEIIENACARQDIKLLDLGLGEERYKTAWADPVPLKDSRLAFSAKGRVIEHLYALRSGVKTAIRNSKLLWPLVRKLRKIKAGLGASAHKSD
ncbi:MAG: GNAT family N-acetyltransferase [Roseibium sp.]|uniref:GNAT family N-acetyltransferase n=1 Tax=Roseibium sp. TaxID=1936156 RepID=UPI001B08D971|nr:GNAT family N-acetyltransferase [Roseibium sp.]MBO6891045.1 GNAT family N-acetyltransferase [Roseibium sp.]MBO6928379.1 GNAT family N-acetyltransferase [Roseibium sp.]